MCPFPMTHRKWDAVGCALQSPAVKEEAFTLTCAASSFPSVTHVKPNVFIKPLEKNVDVIVKIKDEYGMKKKKLHIISLRLFCCVFLDGLVWRCVCEKGRWRSSRNHLPTLGCTAGGGPTCTSLPVHKDISPDFAFGLCHKHSCLLRSVCGSLCVYVSVKQEEVGSAGSLKNWGLLVLWSCRVTKTWMMTEQIKRSDKYKKGDKVRTRGRGL